MCQSGRDRPQKAYCNNFCEIVLVYVFQNWIETHICSFLFSVMQYFVLVVERK